MKIKEYSSLFATKLNYIMDLLGHDAIQYGRISAIQELVNEKETTIKNWMFHASIPRENKKIKIADSLGVSHRYLFNNDIEVEDVLKPEAVLIDNCFYIPLINEKDISNLKNNVLHVRDRVPVMFPGFNELVETNNFQVYATNLDDSQFYPYIERNDMIVFSEKSKLKEYNFVIDRTTKQLKRIMYDETDNKYKFQYFENDKEVVQAINNVDNYLFVIFSYSHSL